MITVTPFVSEGAVTSLTLFDEEIRENEPQALKPDAKTMLHAKTGKRERVVPDESMRIRPIEVG
ncbi:MAG TPA: hypothetical protein VF798_16410 [Burkholderiaceae bacterium]